MPIRPLTVVGMLRLDLGDEIRIEEEAVLYQRHERDLHVIVDTDAMALERFTYVVVTLVDVDQVSDVWILDEVGDDAFGGAILTPAELHRPHEIKDADHNIRQLDWQARGLAVLDERIVLIEAEAVGRLLDLAVNEGELLGDGSLDCFQLESGPPPMIDGVLVDCSLPEHEALIIESFHLTPPVHPLYLHRRGGRRSQSCSSSLSGSSVSSSRSSSSSSSQS